MQIFRIIQGSYTKLIDLFEPLREKWLIIASYDKTKEENVSGSLRMYEFPEVTSAPKLQMEFSDLGKIVDAAYRFRNDGK